MNLEKTIKAVIYSCLFLIPFIPLFVANWMFFPFITGKAFAFRLLVEVAFCLWVALALASPQYRPRKSPIILSFAIFLGIMTIADFTGVNPFKSFWSNFERMEGLVTLIHLFAYFVVLSSTLINEKIWTRFLQTSMWASVVVAFSGLMQYLDPAHIDRLDSTLGNAAYLALYMLVHIFIAGLLLYRSYKVKNKFMPIVYGAVILLEMFVLYGTATRGTILGLIGAFIVGAGIFAFRSESKKIRFISAGIIAAIVIGIAVFISVKDVPAVKNSPVLGRFASISLNDATTKSRFMIWNMAIQGAKERPIFGWGQENFNYIFSKYYNPGMYGQEQWFDRAHNVFFDWLTTGGVLGLLGYLSLFAAAMILIWRNPKDPKNIHLDLNEKVILTGLLVGYFIHNIFVFDNLTSYIIFFMVLAYLHSRAGVHFSLLSDKAVTWENTKSTASIAVIATVAVVYFTNGPAYATNISLIEGMKTGNVTDYSKAISYGSLGTQEARERLLETTSQIIQQANIKDDVKKGFFDLAFKEGKNQIAETPLDARAYVLFTSFLLSTGNLSLADQYSQKALELSPKKQPTLFMRVQILVNQKRYEEAFAVAKQAFEYEENYKEARSTYAMMAIYTKRPDVVSSLYPNGLPLELRFGKAYVDAKEYSKAITLIKSIAESNPNDPQPSAMLSAAYLVSGNYSASVSTLEDLKKRLPQYAQYIDQLIADINSGKNPFSF